MSSAMKAALISSKGNFMHTRTALFHSTPIMERRRRNHWDSRCNHYSKRLRRIHAKEQLLHNVGAYADFLFQAPKSRNQRNRWKDEADEDESPSTRGSSWFKRQYSAEGYKRDRSSNQGSQYRARRGFSMEELGYHGRSWNWRHQREGEYDSSPESDRADSDLASNRQALGLSASGPLKLEDVKNAYRACALKWHPDRLYGSSKVVAEEKFKLCSAAYQSLCDKLAVS